MPEPDPRDRALQNIQDSSRAYGRGRRRGDTANVDPAFAAALEITDPEQRRAALSQYARQRAQGTMPQGGAPQGNPLPSQADVMSQFAPMPETAPDAEPDADMDDNMFADIQRFAPERMSEYQNIPMAGVEDSPEQFRARQNMGKQILAPTYGDQVDARNARNDEAHIESRNAGKPPPGEGVMQFGSGVPMNMDEANAMQNPRPAPRPPAGDGISQIGDAMGNLEQQIMARRRRR